MQPKHNDPEKEEDTHMRNFLKQGIEATKGIGTGLLPRIKYTANDDGTVSEELTWIDPKKDEQV